MTHSGRGIRRGRYTVISVENTQLRGEHFRLVGCIGGLPLLVIPLLCPRIRRLIVSSQCPRITPAMRIGSDLQFARYLKAPQ